MRHDGTALSCNSDDHCADFAVIYIYTACNLNPGDRFVATNKTNSVRKTNC